MNALICAAIAKRTVVQFTYNGGARMVEPHSHGTSTQGHEVLRGYQISGASDSGEPVGWKLFKIENIVDFQETSQRFSGARQGYTAGGAGVVSVHCEL